MADTPKENKEVKSAPSSSKTVDEQKNNSQKIDTTAPETKVETKTQPPAQKKEKTTKGMTNLILEQIRSLIEINVALNNKVKDINVKLESSQKEAKQLKEKVDAFTDRIGTIEGNMEKFIGLYEMVTNKYNPFLAQEEQEQFKKTTNDDVFEGIDIDKLKQDAKNIINDLKKSHVTNNSESVDELTQNIDKTKKTVPTDINYPESDFVKSGEVKTPDIDEFGKYPDNNNQVSKEEIQKHPELTQSNDENLQKLSSEYHFVLNNGNLIKSIPELEKGLEEMDDDTFNHHVNADKNDFYEWIKHSMDPNFAESIKDEKTKEGLKVKLQEHIKKTISSE